MSGIRAEGPLSGVRGETESPRLTLRFGCNSPQIISFIPRVLLQKGDPPPPGEKWWETLFSIQSALSSPPPPRSPAAALVWRRRLVTLGPVRSLYYFCVVRGEPPVNRSARRATAGHCTPDATLEFPSQTPPGVRACPLPRPRSASHVSSGPRCAAARPPGPSPAREGSQEIRRA